MANNYKNFGFRRKSGILMAVSSLPSPYGIGSFGEPCYEWLDFLSATGTKCWQILPLNPTAYGDSPYQSPASFAGNPYFIDLETLNKNGLLTSEELASAIDSSDRIDYGKLFNERYTLLRKAFARFNVSAEYKRFCVKHAEWLNDYAYFMALKVKNGFRSWDEWDKEYKHYALAMEHKAELESEADFWRFLQFEFFKEWKEVRAYAKNLGIKIIGDMPIYVAYDSADVWSNPNQFLLDADLKPVKVAGCPPDGFAPDGQLWGNPIYNYFKMAYDNYTWWISRVKQSFLLYDIVRIDHFRGFAGYYTVPYGDTTARGGKWEIGPGHMLFDAVNGAVPNAKIIAEDLGFITDDVRKLLDYCGYPGMKNLQFAFDDEDSEYLPRMFKNGNCVVYSGTHDADCAYSWCRDLRGARRKCFNAERPRRYADRTYDLIYMAMSSKANLAVIPLQDWLRLPNDKARMNTPSVAEGNWQWRVSSGYATKSLINKIKRMTEETKRLK